MENIIKDNSGSRQGLSDSRVIRALNSQCFSDMDSRNQGSLQLESENKNRVEKREGILNLGLSSGVLDSMTRDIISTEALASFTNATPTNYRVAQACDRCRSKKTRCDGKRPHCSQCASVGFECRISDKLSRRAFPRGYTETLEDRVRKLETENRRLLALCDLKEEQLRLVSRYGGGVSQGLENGKFSSDERKVFEDEKTTSEEEEILRQMAKSDGGSLRVSTVNLFLLNKTTAMSEDPQNTPSDYHIKEIQPQMHISQQQDYEGLRPGKEIQESFRAELKDQSQISSLHGDLSMKNDCRRQPRKNVAFCNVVSTHLPTNINDFTSVPFEQGSTLEPLAVKALNSTSSHEESSQLATLVALSVPSTTEEVLFVPQLLAKIGQVHGFTSKQCLYTASALASLKEILPRQSSPDLDLIRSKSLWEIDDMNTFLANCLRFDFNTKPFFKNGRLPRERLVLYEIEEMISIFFKQWYPLIPIFERSEFNRYWDKFKKNVGMPEFFTSGETLFDKRHRSISYKIFSCLLTVIVQMGLITKVKSEKLERGNRLNNLLQYYDCFIRQFTSNPYFSSNSTSIQSLQFLSLLLFYFLNVGHVNGIYELRSKVVSLSHQLRLYRCPSTVLSCDGSTVSKAQQEEHLILFWGIYDLDVFSSLQLGVPRFFKDQEIEGMLPASLEDNRQINSLGEVVSLKGRILPFSLCIMRYSRVLGNILDSIFKRGLIVSITKDVALLHENSLDNWRHSLPSNMKFHIEVNGTIRMDEFNQLKKDYMSGLNNNVMKEEKFIAILLYFLAKAMIQLPAVANRPPLDDIDFEHDKIQYDRHHGSSSSYISFQQAINTFLYVLNSLKTTHIPFPINMSHTKTRFGLFSARDSLEYIKGGTLFQDNKVLLLDLIKGLEVDRKLGIPGTISWHSLKLFDMAICLILQPPNCKRESQDKLIQKKIKYYDKIIDNFFTFNPVMFNNMILPNQGRQQLFTHDKKSKNLESKRKPIENKPSLPVYEKVKLENDATNTLNSHSNLTTANSYEPQSLSNSVTSTILEDNLTNDPRIELKPSAQNCLSNYITEAFQLDPVLQVAPFSNTEFTSFHNTNSYTSENNLKPCTAASTATSTITAETDSFLWTNDVLIPNELGMSSVLTMAGLAHGKVPSLVNLNVKDGLFKVPSNGDLLKDYYDGMSSNQLFSSFFDGVSSSNTKNTQQTNISNANQNGHMEPLKAPNINDDSKQLQGYEYVVDDSLGLQSSLEISQKLSGVDSIVLSTEPERSANLQGSNLHYFTKDPKFDVLQNFMTNTCPPQVALANSENQVFMNNLPSPQKPASPVTQLSSVPNIYDRVESSYPSTQSFIQDEAVIPVKKRLLQRPCQNWNSSKPADLQDSHSQIQDSAINTRNGSDTIENIFDY